MRIAILSSLIFQQVKEHHGIDRIVWGGAERYLLELCNLMKAQGHEVELFQSINPAGADINRIQAGGVLVKSFCGFKVVCLPSIDYSNSMGTFPNLNATFAEYSEMHDLRIYFVTNLCYPYVKLPAISISHGVFWDYPTAMQNTAYTDEQKRLFVERQVYGFTSPSVCVAVDYNVKNVLRAIAPGKETRTIVVPNFVDTNHFKPYMGASEYREGKQTVLFPRRFVSVRGSNEFLYSSMNNPHIRHLAVGQPNNTAKEKAMKNYKTLEWTHCEPKDMKKYYDEADMTVVPTKSSEGLSLSLLEGLACGIPTITTMNGGLSSGIIPGYNAIVYDQDFHRLSDVIRELSEDKELQSRLRKNARETAMAFDIDIWRENWINILNNC